LRLTKTLKRAAALTLALAGLAAAPAVAAAEPVLVVTDAAGGFGQYYPEILRAEGLNAFSVAPTSALTAGGLAPYDVVVLGEAPVTDAQVAALTAWVQAGGNLIAMRPDPKLAGLLGLGTDGGTLSNAYLGVNTAAGPGAGITSATMQFHGTADRWSGTSAATVATLYSNASASTGQPAVTLRSVGAAGGQAAAFTYDLARSVVYTRQGNPAWKNKDRDHALDTLRRSDDLFYGNDPADPQPDWVDLNKVAIPQADEQQRLLANLITEMNLDRTPLPRFWYLPRGEKAAFVMTGDDHGAGGTTGQFDGFAAAGPEGCSVADWECVRATSYVFPGTALDGREQAFQAAGFEIGLHTNTGCANTPDLDELRGKYAGQLASFREDFPSLRSPRTNRNHCIAWDGWADTAQAESDNGIRLDTNYYYWPGSWVQNRPGMFTGSGFPMRFAAEDGSPIDVYQATTQMTDESGIDIGEHAQALAARALGPDGYYGVFTANMHTDSPHHDGADAIIAAARAAGVPVISAAQLLDWTDGRNASQFQSLAYANGRLTFRVAPGSGARGLEAMLPASAANGALNALTRDGQPVARTVRTVKGIQYHVFSAAAGSYAATYGEPGTTPPDATDPTPGTGGGTTDPPAGSGAGGTGTPSGGSRAGGTTTPSGGSGTGGSVGGGASVAGLRAAVIRSRSVRVAASGKVRVRVSCPPGETPCVVTLRLRKDGKQIVRRHIVTIRPGATRTVTFRLSRTARARLARARSMTVDATASTRSGAASPATTRNTVRLLAPRR
jgi:hypothetical protein